MDIPENGNPVVTSGQAIKLVNRLLELGIAPEHDLIQAAGDKKLAMQILQQLKTRKFVTKQLGGPEFQFATVYTIVNLEQARQSDASKLIQTLFEPSATGGLRYGNYETAKVAIEFLAPSLGGLPIRNDFCAFRRMGDSIWLTSGQQHAMLNKAARLLPGLQQKATQAIDNYYVFFQEQTLPESSLAPEPVKTIAPQGKGLVYHEALPAGMRLDLTIKFPTTVLKEADIRNILLLAGTYIGLSPAKSNQGFGRFKVA